MYLNISLGFVGDLHQKLRLVVAHILQNSLVDPT